MKNAFVAATVVALGRAGPFQAIAENMNNVVGSMVQPISDVVKGPMAAIGSVGSAGGVGNVISGAGAGGVLQNVIGSGVPGPLQKILQMFEEDVMGAAAVPSAENILNVQDRVQKILGMFAAPRALEEEVEADWFFNHKKPTTTTSTTTLRTTAGSNN